MSLKRLLDDRGVQWYSDAAVKKTVGSPTVLVTVEMERELFNYLAKISRGASLSERMAESVHMARNLRYGLGFKRDEMGVLNESFHLLFKEFEKWRKRNRKNRSVKSVV